MSEILRVGIAGLGTVGAAVVRLLDAQAADLAARTGKKVVVTGVSARDPARDRGIDLSGATWFSAPTDLARSDKIDLFVELIGGDEGPARESVEAALAAGKSVVTANKALLAKHGIALARLAEAHHGALAFEASVAGGIPIVKTLREGLAGNRIERVYGILNGTCNYILSRMELEGLSFAECLADAQKLGYAEADPTFDIGGFDTAHKLAILASLAFGVKLDAEAISVEGIQDISLADLQAASELGYRVKLLGVAQRTPHGVEQRVHPTMVPLSSAIAQVMGVTNAVTVDADAVNELTLVGPGAGGMATASAVVADIADIARGIRSAPFGLPVDHLASPEKSPMQRHEGGYYIRLAVRNEIGAAAAIATRMAEHGISLESIVQRRACADASVAPVVLVTYATTEASVREALAAIVADGHVADKPQVIRIERE
ncbi:homoserine dehydrogenase [Rhodoblastus acidophilus]|uniref:Homoserine dehydrogenase n=1 Tax=Candidatus Rhodoblastus alkanivorans TaxID=2954117 RepID=A0ABS9Z6R2_9HYPH|nr:homoserine dehydrogenase [Candidatus Rhodoblastus alkanivorans]MCI4680726.1 homoserine dehydrogenase [Candidatus Rhodoblastus alkanivorans]MCI4683365.1 homoserine dehydrogenase [Candidatus Rhodoblastus alkanivorans]MDI4640677.1 homoserine dehydrogenase [Rhodoblastus acidophilus]